jgi:hypothetical protein
MLLASVARAQDFQSWNEVDIAASWRRVDFMIPLLARVDSSLPNPQLAATGVTADFPLPWHLKLTGGYLFADLPQRSESVHVPLVALSATFRLGRLTMSDRNRFEKLIGFAGSPVRYRNRLLFDLPFGKHDRWHVFADDEAFFNLSVAAWNQNRFQVGGGARLNSRLLLDVYFLERSLSAGAPKMRAVGTSWKVILP